MKFQTVTRKIMGEYTRNGVTHPVEQTEAIKVPKFAADWQTIGLRAAVTVVLALTTIAIVWSTHSIGNLLNGGIGYLVAVIFDAAWGVALLLEYLARYDKAKRTFPTRLGWVLLVATMGAIFWDGAMIGDWAMAVVGAFVSLFAKVLWLGVMKHIYAELSLEDAQWLAAEKSAADTEVAHAIMRRQTEQRKQTARLQLMAMEAERNRLMTDLGLDVPTVTQGVIDVEADEVPALERPTIADMGKSDAIRFARGQMPDADAEVVADALQSEGVDVTLAYVKQVFARTTTAEPEPEAEIIALHK